MAVTKDEVAAVSAAAIANRSPAMPLTEPRRADQAAERALTTWCDLDATHVLHSRDHAAIGETEALRALVLDLLARSGPSRDLYTACARLGRLLAEVGASPSLAVVTLDGASRALTEIGVAHDPAQLLSARASLAEGYVAAIVETERTTARRAWDPPACTVEVARDVVAIAAGVPSDDRDALVDWAARVAREISRAGYRFAIVAGAVPAKSELADALSMLGIELVPDIPRRGFLRSLWKRL